MPSASGGRWPVLLSTRAMRQLRKLERDQNCLEAVSSKIKELSSGHFTAENHRVINGTLQHIPLFRARAPYDLRIIYQVDVHPDSAGNRDHQVIKIYRIESRAQIDYQFWAKVSVRLKRFNSLYQKRCAQLAPCVNGYRRPTVFPHVDYGATISKEHPDFILYDWPQEELDEMQEIIMERFAPMNKSLYNSIAADLDMVFPMVLDEHERRVVNHDGASIVIGRSGTGKTTALLYKMRAVDQANVAQKSDQKFRQVLVTRSRVLAQHVESTYRGLEEFTNIAHKSPEELKEMARRSREDPGKALVEFDTEIDLRNDLPKRFSELQDSNFPLFVSFDTLCSLLEADLRHYDLNELGSLESRRLIGFNEFLHNYWPSFKGMTHDLLPQLVYSEIVGVIKGSQRAFESAECHLSRKEYVENLSYRQFPLPTHARDTVYSIFELYARNKRSRCEVDPADRTRAILRNMSSIVANVQIDYLYVDEVQDNLMIDIYLLRSLVGSVDRIYWSGDSAQTVVAGSAFRINDLKAFTYVEQRKTSYAGLARKVPAQFETFELQVNFRSLSGIVDFARFVIQGLYDWFPESIDPMEPEKAKDTGDPPTLFTNIQNTAGYFESFLLGSNASNRVPFGAQQAILVRDAEAAEKLDNRLQGLCIVLPIMDSKGLEFNDVLLYDFFSSSPVPASAWGFLSGSERGNQVPPPTLCAELKLLYVAATRARHRCWIWDSGHVVDRLKAIWIPRGLVRVESAANMVGSLAVSSNVAQWSTKGREFFSQRLYKLAAACFRQAGEDNDARVSTAYHLMTRAKLKHLRGDTPAAREALVLAASEMVSCAELPGIGTVTNFYYHAAICYQSASKLHQAATAFIEAGRPTQGIQMLFDARDFKYGAKLLMANHQRFERDAFVGLRLKARLHFFDRRDYIEITRLFTDVDKQIDFARKRRFRPQLKHILESDYRYDDLAEAHMEDKDVRQAVAWCFKAHDYYGNPDSIDRAMDFAIQHTKSVLLVEGVYRQSGQDLAREVIQQVQPHVSTRNGTSAAMIDLFYEYLLFNQVSPAAVKHLHATQPMSQSEGILGCYLAVKNSGWLSDDSEGLVLEYLAFWKSYKTGLLDLVNASRPSSSPVAQKLLGFSLTGSSGLSPSATFLETSFIHRQLNRPPNYNRTAAPASEIDRIIHKSLPMRLHAMLEALHKNALTSHWTRPDSFSSNPQRYILQNDPSDAARLIHAAPPNYLVICRILDVLDCSNDIPYLSDLTVEGQLWLQRIFEVTFRGTGEIGCLSILSAARDSGSVIGCLQRWLQRTWNAIKNVRPSGNAATNLLRHAILQSTLEAEVFRPNSASVAHIGHVRYSEFDRNVGSTLHEYIFGRGADRLTKAVDFLGRILGSNIHIQDSYPLDPTVVIHFVEMLTRDIILHMNSNLRLNFDKLLMPFTWIRTLAHRYRGEPIATGFQGLPAFFSTVEWFSHDLRFGKPGRWLKDGKPLPPGTVDLLNLRLCWCIALGN